MNERIMDMKAPQIDQMMRILRGGEMCLDDNSLQLISAIYQELDQFSQWDSKKIKAVYRDFKNDVGNRDHCGYGALYYSDRSGRNDIVNAKVCEDARNVYFYVDTAEALSPSTDHAWMTLFLNVKKEQTGYDFCVNRTSPKNGKACIEAVTQDGYETLGSADIRFEDNKLMLRVPKALLDLSEKASFTFKWADNYEDGNLMSFYTKGDSAPYGRLNWIYQ